MESERINPIPPTETKSGEEDRLSRAEIEHKTFLLYHEFKEAVLNDEDFKNAAVQRYLGEYRFPVLEPIEPYDFRFVRKGKTWSFSFKKVENNRHLTVLRAKFIGEINTDDDLIKIKLGIWRDGLLSTSPKIEFSNTYTDALFPEKSRSEQHSNDEKSIEKANEVLRDFRRD